MMRLTITPALLTGIKRLEVEHQLLGISDSPSLDEAVVGKPISHEQILEISRRLKQLDRDSHNESPDRSLSCTLDDLLRGSQIYIEPPKPRNEPTTEYKELMAHLRREEERRAYERMVNPPPTRETFAQRFPNSSHANLFPKSQEDVGEDDEITYGDVNRQMALIINIVVSIIACSVALWLAARHWNTPSRLGLSMGGSVAVAIAEAVVYAGYLRRLREAREKGKKEVEIKEIMKTWVIGGDEGKDSSDPITITSKESTNQTTRRRTKLR
ncbi:hypothetical protein ACLMJK_000367 [Lecanora helva]